MDEQLSDNVHAVLRVVSTVPSGKVATYGQVARLAGLPGNARQVGSILKQLPEGSMIPWHRVINARGQSSLSGHARALQLQRLSREGVHPLDGRIDLTRYQWYP